MRIKVLGSGQDAGIPHPGCQCGVCNRARKNARYKRRGPSIAILNDRTKKKEGFCYLIDASPDFKHQLDMVRKEIGDVRRRGRVPVSGILLTHAHFGHVSGLWYLGNESVKESNLPVFCTPRIEHFLKRKHPFNLLVRRKNIKVRRILKSREVKIERFGCTPFSVPHRSDSIETVGYIIRSMKSKKTLVYVPDVDYWTDRVIDIIRSADIALIDGSFYSKDELPRFMQVPHPPIKESIRLLQNPKGRIYFTHINHTNPVNRNGRERKSIEKKGFRIARDGMILKI